MHVAVPLSLSVCEHCAVLLSQSVLLGTATEIKHIPTDTGTVVALHSSPLNGRGYVDLCMCVWVRGGLKDHRSHQLVCEMFSNR